MDSLFDIALLDCPYCGGTGCFEEEGGWCLYIQCLECGSQTAEFSYQSPAERSEMAARAARLWNMGKVISPRPGE